MRALTRGKPGLGVLETGVTENPEFVRSNTGTSGDVCGELEGTDTVAGMRDGISGDVAGVETWEYCTVCTLLSILVGGMLPR